MKGFEYGRVLTVGSRNYYYTGTGGLHEMQVLADQISESYRIPTTVVATYRGFFLGDYRYGTARRAEIYFTK